MITQQDRKRCPDQYWNLVVQICLRCSCLPIEEIESRLEPYKRLCARFRDYPLPELQAARVCCTNIGYWTEEEDYTRYWIKQMIQEIRLVYQDSLYGLASRPHRFWDRPPGYPDYTDGDFERFELYRLERLNRTKHIWDGYIEKTKGGAHG